MQNAWMWCAGKQCNWPMEALSGQSCQFQAAGCTNYQEQ